MDWTRLSSSLVSGRRAGVLAASVFLGCTEPSASKPQPSTKQSAEPSSPAQVTTPKQLVAGKPSPDFQLVAARNGDIELHRGWDEHGSERMILLATLPFPVTSEGEVVSLPGLYDGLIAPTPDYGSSLYAEIAGGFSGPDDGWLTLGTEVGMKDHWDVPITYQWKAPGWQVHRERRGRFTELYRYFITRGQTVFGQAHYLRLDFDTQMLIIGSTKPERKGAPPGRLVPLRGDLPPPQTSVRERRLHHHSNSATTSNGDLHYATFVPDPDSDRYPVMLFSWDPGQTASRSLPLPDRPFARKGKMGSPQVGGLSSAHLKVTASSNGLVISGHLWLPGSAKPMAYLAVGQPDTLTRLAVNDDGAPCSGVLTSAALGPDGHYWLAIDGKLHSRDSHGEIHEISTPDLRANEPALDLRDWAWSPPPGWTLTGRSANDDIRNLPTRVEEIVRIGDDFWLRVAGTGYHEVVAIFKTGPSVAPRVLPSNERIHGELNRRGDRWVELRLLDSADDSQFAAFEADVLPQLRDRPEVRQIYEIQRDGGRGAVVVIAPNDGSDDLLRAYTALLGREPVPVHEPETIVRMIVE